MTAARVFALVAVFAVLAVWAARGQNVRKQPVYVGARACGSCHEGPGMGHQYSLWLHSKHSQAFASLARPEAKKIAEISGLRDMPQESPICLGCHSTAYRAESWQKDDTFRIEDGVQCEYCHGPGSDYMEESVMRNREAAMKAGLIIPAKDRCMTCHIEKGSHVAVLKRPPLNLDDAWQKLAHPLPKSERLTGAIPVGTPEGIQPAAGPKFVGAMACGSCHQGEMFGHQYSVWRMGPHSRAYSVLASPRAFEIARAKGITGNPQTETACLECHVTGADSPPQMRTTSFWQDEGVGCESCHGAGSEYMHDAIMRDKRAAAQNGLKRVTRETCLGCHDTGKAHGKPFDYDMAQQKIAHPSKPTYPRAEVRYKTPLNLMLTPDGKQLWTAGEASDTVMIVDTARRQKIGEIKVGGQPNSVAFTPDGKLAFVSNRLDDTVSVVNVASREVIQTLEVGDEPHGLITDRDGKYLYVLNTSSEDITVIELATMQRVKTLAASRHPWKSALSPDGSRILVTNALAKLAPFRTATASEVTVIETRRGTVEDRYDVPGTNLVLGVAWHPSGEYAIATMNRTKSMVPMTRLMQGWTITNGIAVISKDGTVDQVLLDEPGQSFADAIDVAFTPDGRYALVTSSGTDQVAVIDTAKLMALIRRSTPYEREHVLPNHMGKADEFLVKNIPVKNSPRGIVVAPDGRTAYVANSLDDSISAIDLRKMETVARIDLDGPKVITQARFGERLFHSANISFRRQMACHTCHPDGHVDGITYDIEADGIGISPVDNRTLRGIHDTAPFKWEGTNPTLSRQCGARLAVFFTRNQPFTPEQLAAVDLYVTTIPRPPNRYHTPGKPYTAAQLRGKMMFERTIANDGRTIPLQDRCVTCHFPPYFTNRQRHDVGTKQPSDRTGNFDVPHLNNIYDSAPYLHNGMALTLEEIWTVYNPYDRHGVTNDMTKDQLNDLIEYLKTL
jgi:YVTN family beta-propeller protein